jgi:dienelactone hydrolase
LIPDKEGKKPAVITVFYEPETAAGIGGKPYRDFALQLAKRGFITLSLGTSETTKNKTYSIYYPNIADASMQPLSALAFAAANAWEALAKVDNVDSTKIGIVGHSYGGKWAMFASCLYDKFACSAWVDPGIVFDETCKQPKSSREILDFAGVSYHSKNMSRYISQLIDAGYLYYTIPENTSHRSQKYFTIENHLPKE